MVKTSPTASPFSLVTTFKGTFQPDWICMRVVSLESSLKGHQPLYVLNFLFLILNIWKDFKVMSHFMQKLIQAPACSDHGLHRILSSYWLAHFYLAPKSYFILVWIAEWWNSLPSCRNPKNNWYLSHIFGARFGEKNSSLSTCKPWSKQAGGLEAFLHEAAQNLEVVSKIQHWN